MVDDQFTEDSGVADFNEQVWRVLRERGQLTENVPLAPTFTETFAPLPSLNTTLPGKRWGP